MTNDVQQEFLEFHNLNSDAAARRPPPIGIEGRVARGSNRHCQAMAAHRSTKHPAQAPRMVGIAHDDN